MILKIFYVAAALDSISLAMCVTVMNPYVYSLGGTQVFLGTMGSISAFVTLVWNPIVGSLSDRLGRKIVLLSCISICFIGNFLSGLSSNLTFFFISRILTAFGTQILTLIKSLIDDNIQSQDTKMSIITKIQALGAFCFVIGSIIAGHLSELDPRYAFFLISANFAINFALICLIEDKQVLNKKDSKESFNIFTEIKLAAKNLTNINWPKYWDLFTIKLITDFVLNIFFFNSTLILAQRFQIAGKSFGYLVAAMSVIGITTSLTMMKLKKFFYPKDDFGFTRLLHGCLLMVITYLGLSFSSSFTFFIIYLIPQNIGRVLLETTTTEVLLLRASPEEKGSIMGAFDSTLSLGGLVAPIMSGVIADIWGVDVCILLCVVPLLVASGLAYTQKIKSH